MSLGKEKIVNVLRPLYGMPKTATYWFKPYSEYHKLTSSKLQTTLEVFLLFRENKNNLKKHVGIQVDDTICAGALNFYKNDEHRSTEFPNKVRIDIVTESTRCNGVEIGCKPDGENFVMNQSKYISKFIKENFCNELSFNKIHSIRAKYAFVKFFTVPDALVYVEILAQYIEQRFMAERNDGLKYVKKLQKVVI